MSKLSHNLKIAWRNLLKYKLQTSISILSLTVGMVCFALSALWLRYETSYDTWWPEHDDVYLVQYSGSSGYYMEGGFSNYLSYPAILLAMFVLIFLTVIWQMRKAARENPADVIKSE